MSEKSDAKIISEAKDVKKPKGLHLLKAEKIDTPEKFARLARMTQEEFLEEVKKAGGVSELLRKAAPFKDVEIEDDTELTELKRCKNCGVEIELNESADPPLWIHKDRGLVTCKKEKLIFWAEPSQPKRQDYVQHEGGVKTEGKLTIFEANPPKSEITGEMTREAVTLAFAAKDKEFQDRIQKYIEKVKTLPENPVKDAIVEMLEEMKRE